MYAAPTYLSPYIPKSNAHESLSGIFIGVHILCLLQGYSQIYSAGLFTLVYHLS